MLKTMPRAVPTPRIAFGTDLQLHMTATVDVDTGGFRAVDLRLHRRAPSSTEFHPTSAGFRVPRDLLRQMSGALAELADALEGR